MIFACPVTGLPMNLPNDECITYFCSRAEAEIAQFGNQTFAERFRKAIVMESKN